MEAVKSIKNVVKNDENKYSDFICPRKNVGGISRTGYFIGYRLIEKYVNTLDKLSEK